MKEMCFCGECMGSLLLGTGFHLFRGDEGYEFDTEYDISEDKVDFYWDLIQSTIKAGFEVGKNRWINDDDAYDNVDRAVLTRAGIDPFDEELDELAVAGLFAIGRSAFIAGLVDAKTIH